MAVQHLTRSDSIPSRLMDVEGERLEELGRRISIYGQKVGISKPIGVFVRRSDPLSEHLFEASAHYLESIHLQNHWLLRPSDIPNTSDRFELKKWFASFMGASLKKIDDRYYDRVILPMIELVRSGDFENIRDCILLHELGHIVQDRPLVDKILFRRKVGHFALRFVGLVAFALMPISWFILSNPTLFLILGLLLGGCMFLASSMPRPEDPPFSTGQQIENERKADLFAAKHAPGKVLAYIDYFHWQMARNRAIRGDSRTPDSIKQSYDEAGEVLHSATHPKYSDRIALLQKTRT